MKDSTENEVLKMIKIISDSTCDLSQEVLERYDIDIIPLHIVKGDEELEDGPQIDIHACMSGLIKIRLHQRLQLHL